MFVSVFLLAVVLLKLNLRKRLSFSLLKCASEVLFPFKAGIKVGLSLVLLLAKLNCGFFYFVQNQLLGCSWCFCCGCPSV